MRRITQSGNGRQNGLRYLAMALLVLMMAVAPLKPAKASGCCVGTLMANIVTTIAEAASWVAEKLEYVKYLDSLNAFSSAINDYIAIFDDKMARVDNAIVSAMYLQSESQVRAFQGVADNIRETMFKDIIADILVKNLPPPKQNTHLCETMNLRATVPVIEGGAKLNVAAMKRGVEFTRLGKAFNNTGPEAAEDFYRQRCDLGLVNPLDAYDSSECKPDTTGYLTDADLSPPDDRVMELPAFVTKTLTTPSAASVPMKAPPAYSSMTREQKLWMAKMNYCYNIVTPHANPPYGTEEQLTPKGITATSQFNHCAAIQSAFTEQCVERVAKYTRPNCTNTASELEANSTKELCAASKSACIYAKKMDMNLPDDIDCDRGLSPYQIELISHTACMGNTRTIKTLEGGTNIALVAGQGNMCAELNAAWKSQLAYEKDALIAAIQSMEEMSSCWAKTQKTYVTDIDKKGLGNGKKEARFSAPTTPRAEKTSLKQEKPSAKADEEF